MEAENIFVKNFKMKGKREEKNGRIQKGKAKRSREEQGAAVVEANAALVPGGWMCQVLAWFKSPWPCTQ